MAWTAPRTWVVGEIVTAAIGNTHWRDNLRYLKGLDGATTLSDALILPDGAGFYLHIPILTTAQRDALTPTAGMLVYNSTTTQFNKYENGAWRADLGYNSDHGGLSGMGDDDHTQYLLESLLTTQGDLPYATAASTWARLPKGTASQFLRMNAGATAPEWAGVAVVTGSGTYEGDNGANKAIAHGLGVTPKIVHIMCDEASGEEKFWHQIFGTMAFIYWQDSGTPTAGRWTVTIPDSTNFYVGNGAQHTQTANNNAKTYRWVAIG